MPTPTSDAPPAEAATHDELGYVIVDSPAPVVTTEDKPAEVADDKIEKPATGYSDEVVADEPVKEDEKPADEEIDPDKLTDEQKSQKEIKEVIKDLGAGYDKAKIEKFALENKLNKDQLAAYVKMTKEEDAQFIKDREAAKVKYRNDNIKELKEDPDFGGENFLKNVDRVEKLLEKNMPSTKKMLTEKGGMLPPYIMKDLLSLSRVLNPVAPLVIGEPPTPDEKNGNFLDDLYK